VVEGVEVVAEERVVGVGVAEEVVEVVVFEPAAAAVVVEVAVFALVFVVGVVPFVELQMEPVPSEGSEAASASPQHPISARLLLGNKWAEG